VAGTVGAPVAGSPVGAPTVARYSGKCAALSAAVGSYVQDGSPGAEKVYNVQFYVFTGLSAGTATVFQAQDGASATVVKVDYDSGAGTFTFTSLGNAAVSGVLKNKWYMINMGWTANAPNTMSFTVQGAGASAPLVGPTSVTTSGTASIETAQLGWIANPGTPGVAAPGIITDAFVSQRATAPARLCRGDANNDNILSIQDRILITAEILAGNANLNFLAPGQPDANEDGLVSIQDRIIVTARILAGNSCP
jgi:hypothetical protein